MTLRPGLSTVPRAELDMPSGSRDTITTVGLTVFGSMSVRDHTNRNGLACFASRN
ncbi:hypothetical protein [Halosaccharopolyspora lacisalsi]|uniref:hypothetical protein n=1 Tax=Halosaccharopolyspora lacisalsi TaxID=1000566 RepID=UPI001F2B3F60|nr:hypothetical protein [Halosaccharopolyspora lacisalsi]